MRRTSWELTVVAILLISLCLYGFSARAGDFTETPADVQAALFTKILGYDKSLPQEVTVYVLRSSTFTSALKKAEGRSFGSWTLARVESGDELPSQPPDVLYVGDAAVLDEALTYTRDHGILSITGVPGLVKEGVTLGVATDQSDGKPKLLLNPGSSKKEDVSWNPVVMKFVTVQE